MVFRTQFLLTGPGLQPWHSDAHFIAGMTRYLQVGGSGVGNLTLNGWLPFNATQTPARPHDPASCQAAAGARALLLRCSSKGSGGLSGVLSACGVSHMQGPWKQKAASSINHAVVLGACLHARALISGVRVRQDVLALVTVPPAELAQAIWVGMSGSTLVRPPLRPALRHF